MNRTTLPAVVMMIALALSSVSPAFAAENRSISKKDINVLLATAKTPAEHRKIAAYYQQEALRLTASSREHEALAATYQKGPATIESKQGTSFGQGASHCKLWAEMDARQAKEAEALATLHEGMAQEAEKR